MSLVLDDYVLWMITSRLRLGDVYAMLLVCKRFNALLSRLKIVKSIKIVYRDSNVWNERNVCRRLGRALVSSMYRKFDGCSMAIAVSLGGKDRTHLTYQVGADLVRMIAGLYYSRADAQPDGLIEVLISAFGCSFRLEPRFLPQYFVEVNNPHVADAIVKYIRVAKGPVFEHVFDYAMEAMVLGNTTILNTLIEFYKRMFIDMKCEGRAFDFYTLPFSTPADMLLAKLRQYSSMMCKFIDGMYIPCVRTRAMPYEYCYAPMEHEGCLSLINLWIDRLTSSST